MKEMETKRVCPVCGKHSIWARNNGYRFGEIEYYIYCKNTRTGECTYTPEYVTFSTGGIYGNGN